MTGVIKRAQVRMDDDKVSVRPTAAGVARPESKRPASGARILRVDGRAHAIEVTCACGRKTVLELDYATSEESVETNHEA